MSQLDLALAAEVSSRHISFLETGRSQPSVEMVLYLAETLDVPLRERNDLLRAAGFEAHYAEPTVDDVLDGSLGLALEAMLEHHEPFPLIVVDRLYRVVRTNRAAARLFELVGLKLGRNEVNLLKVMFAAEGAELIPNWEEVAVEALRRLQRELLHRPQDEEMQALLADLLATPGIPDSWRQPDPGTPSDPQLTLELRVGEATLSFLTTITAFNAPNNVTLDELRIESWFPLDAETTAVCDHLLGGRTQK